LVAALSLLAVATIWYLSLSGSVNSPWYGMFGPMMRYNNGGQSYGMEAFWILLIPSIALLILGVAGIAYFLVFPEIRRSLSTPTGQPLADKVDSQSSSLLSSSSSSPPVVTPPAVKTATVPSPNPPSFSSASVSPVSDTVSTTKSGDETPVTIPSSSSNSNLSWPFLMKTSKQDEKKILEVLASHDGVYLQKLIAKESGLSKLQSHRIIARLEERGIVKVVESGNTNQVSLAKWLGTPPRQQEQGGAPFSF
jgi:hypothetical protein